MHAVPGNIDTLLAIRADGRLLLARERVALLEAVIQYGSITKAAEHAGFSYKTAWDAVNAINNLLPRPAFITHTGGPHGGGAEVTDEGRRLIVAFRRLEAKLGRMIDNIVSDGLATGADLLFWALAMKLSVNNAFYCKIVEIVETATQALVTVSLGEACQISAEIDRRSADELQLSAGRDAVALINAASIMLARVDGVPRISARSHNMILGRVIRRLDDEENSEITVDIGNDKIMITKVSLERAHELEIQPGLKVWTIFSKSQVILAWD